MIWEGISWRMSLGDRRGTDGPDHGHGRMKEEVRDLEIRWNLPDPCDHNSKGLGGTFRQRLEGLMLDSRRRRRCVVRIERGSYKSTWIRTHEMAVLAVLECFEEVVIEVRMGTLVPWYPNRLFRGSVERVAGELRGWMEAMWGKCEEEGDGDGQSAFVFHPVGDGRAAERCRQERDERWKDANDGGKRTMDWAIGL